MRSALLASSSGPIATITFRCASTATPFNYGKLGSAFWPDEHAVLSPFDFESVTNGGYVGPTGCVSSTDGTFADPMWNGSAQPLSRHDSNSVYRMYANPLGKAQEDATFGNALAAGDFDDDGIEDLVVADLDPLTTSAIINLSFFKGVELDESEAEAGRIFEPWGLTGVVRVNRITAVAAGLQSGPAHGFGASLTTGKLTALDHDDLVVGARTPARE